MFQIDGCQKMLREELNGCTTPPLLSVILTSERLEGTSPLFRCACVGCVLGVCWVCGVCVVCVVCVWCVCSVCVVCV